METHLHKEWIVKESVNIKNAQPEMIEKLITEYRMSGDPKYKEVIYNSYKEVIYNSLKGTIERIVRLEFGYALYFNDKDDLISAGTLGLLNAIERYDSTDPSSSFLAYSYFKIKGGIGDMLRRENFLPLSIMNATKKIKSILENLEKNQESNLSVEEIMEITGHKRETVLDALNLIYLKGKKIYSLDSPINTFDDDRTLHDLISYDKSKSSDSEESKKEYMNQIIQKALSLLPKKDREMIIDHYYREITFEEIGKKYGGVNKSTISRNFDGIHEKLRRIIDPSELGYGFGENVKKDTRERGKLIDIVTKPYEWYGLDYLESKGISTNFISHLLSDDNSIKKIDKNKNKSLLGAYIIAYCVREKLVDKERMEELEPDVRHLNPLKLARILEIEPISLIDDKASIIRKMFSSDGSLDYLLRIEDVAKLKIPPVDMTNLESIPIENLIKRYRLSGDENYKEILYKRLENSVHIPVNEVFKRLPNSIEKDELISMAVLGLFDSIERYDFNRDNGGKFTTFAYARIKGAIMDGLREMDFLPRGIREAIKKIKPYLEKTEEKNISIDLLIKKTGHKRETVLAALNVITSSGSLNSLDKYIKNSEGDNMRLYDVIPYEEDNNQINHEKIEDVVGRALALLPKKEREIIIEYYYNQTSLTKLGKKYGLTESRMSQIKTEIEGKLRNIIDPSARELIN